MSCYSELFDDFIDKIKRYTEKLDVTEYSFMRTFSEGVHRFQRETRYVENMVDVIPNNNGLFLIPDDMLYLVELRDRYNRPMLVVDPLQFQRIKDQWWTNRIETPVNYSYRIRSRQGEDILFRFPFGLEEIKEKLARIATIYERQLKWFPDHEPDHRPDTKFTLWYIPDLRTLSRFSPQWAAWFPHETNFEPLFRTQQVHPSLLPFEEGFVSYAVAKWLQSQGNVNYKVFEAEYNESVAMGKANKPVLYQEGVAVYNMAPFS